VARNGREKWRRALRRLWIRVGYPLAAFVFPSICFGCGETLGPFQHLGACARCWTSFVMLRPPLCRGCGLPAPEGTDLLGPARGRCARCVLWPGQADLVLAAVAYDALARSFLLRAKVGLHRELLAPLAERLSRVVLDGGFAGGCSMVVPVPSHPLADLRRGFSPALEMARPLARRLGLPLPRRLLSRRLLDGSSTKRLPAHRRRSLASRAYRARWRLEGQRVLLIDDVMTSGATVGACAGALKRAGAAEVRAAVWARTLPRPGAPEPRWRGRV
jgi:predicted amidophosphoribosyltransferase